MAPAEAEGLSGIYVVIMAGGKGTRFWPLSRETFPKQFLKIVGERTLLQDTIHRLGEEVSPSRITFVTTAAQRDLVSWQVRDQIGEAEVIVEPEGRNTAPAIALATYKIFKRDRRAMILVLPSDHHIAEPGKFRDTMREAIPVAAKGRLVTFGVVPSRAETAYGYIKRGKPLGPGGAYLVERFVEKPDHKTAAQYLKDGSYYWNAGMFLFRAKDMIEEFAAHMPELHKAMSALSKSFDTDGETEALKKAYPKLPEDSIDYGVMEKSTRVAVVEAGFAWSDIGSWNALEDVLERDAAGNVKIGNVTEMGCEGSIFFAGGKLIAAIGLKDTVVVDTVDATLIAPKDKVQQVKELVGLLKKEGKGEYLSPAIEERPWGYFSVLEHGSSYKIKHIYVKPKCKLSLQMHNHRSEHWIVVAGSALVQRGEETFFVHRNESTYIPPTVRHRLENTGMIPLRIIEIQSGEYLGEDDIMRFDDSYGRLPQAGEKEK